MSRKTAATLLAAVMLLSGCASKDAGLTSNQTIQTSTVVNSSSDNPSCPSIRETVQKFSSDAYMGRLIGTVENAKAAQDLALIFLSLQLEWFFRDSYLQQYVHNFSDQQKKRFGFKENTIQAYNVIGKIPGKDSKSAIVLSAHFDHIGSSDNKIYYGAVDNCSGLAVLLDVAKKLRVSSKNNQFSCDVIICAFNGEEFGLQGSNAFVKSIKGSYENVVSINLDSLHGKEDKKLILVGDATIGSNLINLTKIYFSKYGFDCEVMGLKYPGDHLSFSTNGISSITLGQEAASYLHTPDDTPDKIDFSFLEKVSNCLYSFIVSHGNELFN